MGRIPPLAAAGLYLSIQRVRRFRYHFSPRELSISLVLVEESVIVCILSSRSSSRQRRDNINFYLR
jgi:hypothetical protein